MIKHKCFSDSWSVDFTNEIDAKAYQAIHGGSVDVFDEQEIPEATNSIVPVEVSLWRIRAKLSLIGLDTQASAAIEGLPEPKRTIARSAWEYAYVIERYSETVMFLQQVLSLTESQVDQIFIEASEMVV